MKIQSKSRKSTFLVIIVILLLAASVGAWYYISQRDSDPTNYDAPSEEQSQAGEETREQQSPDGDSTTDGSENTPPSNQDGSQGADASQQGVIHITVSTQENSTYTIRTLIQGNTIGGTCELNLQRNGATVLRETVSTQQVASNSTCMGFDFDTTNLQAGTYTAAISYTNTSGESLQTSESIRIN